MLGIPDRAEIAFGAECEEALYRSSSFGGAPERADTWINSIYGEVTAAPFRAPVPAGLSLTAGIRHDDHRTFGSETTFAASGAFTPDEGPTVVRASYGEGFKAPSLYQLYSQYGNRSLQPETADSWDLGVTHSFLGERAQIGATRFERDTTNLINFVSCFDQADPICVDRPFGTCDNIAAASTDGWELGIALFPVDGFDLALNYTIVDAFDDSNGNRLPRRARDKVSLMADYRMDGGIGLGATVLMVGDSFDNASNTRPLDGYVVVDVRASYAMLENVELFGRIENKFGADYETVFQYGQPGRGFFGGVRYAM
ncbi:TonB-dependent receptor [Croceicoccus sp. F390]|uniref:TonB-dependent receptor n=1 Tax=Croceicoccus esteveae TaxID=3075597 RepID=A0ABU2ZH52_9SPHN|nr:TonB-dependent receptor [Croceicoccus sp. F390]MDT0575936.1 TonB-dependent receptor [Croceicoccus sp. F390]